MLYRNEMKVAGKIASREKQKNKSQFVTEFVGITVTIMSLKNVSEIDAQIASKPFAQYEFSMILETHNCK